MTETDAVVEAVVNEVLETMFFSAVFGPGVETEGPRLTARVPFSGSRSGALEVSALEDTVQSLACSFLGAMPDELPPGQAPGLLGEIANVLCGAVLGRIEPEGRFRISPPEVTAGAPSPASCDLHQVFELAEGWLAVSWRDS